MTDTDTRPASSFDPAWEQEHARREWGTFPDWRVVNFAQRHYGHVVDRKSIGFLDLGCGAGAQAFELAKMGFSVRGVDGSRSAIARCISRMTPELDQDDRVMFRVGDALDLPFNSGGFDAVVEVAVLQHLSWDDASKAVREVDRVLVPGGRFLSIAAAPGHDPVPIPGDGLMRIMSQDQIPLLWVHFEELDWDIHTHVDPKGQKVVWWRITGRKP